MPQRNAIVTTTTPTIHSNRNNIHSITRAAKHKKPQPPLRPCSTTSPKKSVPAITWKQMFHNANPDNGVNDGDHDEYGHNPGNKNRHD